MYSLYEVLSDLFNVDVFYYIAPDFRDFVDSGLFLYEDEFVALRAFDFVDIGVEEVDDFFDKEDAVGYVIAFVVYFKKYGCDCEVEFLYEVVLVGA